MNSIFDRNYIDFEMLESGVLIWPPDSGTVKVFYDGDLAYTGDASSCDAPAITEPSTITVIKTVVGSWEYYNSTNSIEYMDGDQGFVKLNSEITSPYSAISNGEIIFSISELEPIEFKSLCGYFVSGIPAEAGEISINFVVHVDSSYSVILSLNGLNSKTYNDKAEFTYNDLLFELDFDIINASFSDNFMISYKSEFKTIPLPYGNNDIILHDDIYNVDFQTVNVFSRDKHFDCEVSYILDKSGTHYSHKLNFKRNDHNISTIYVYSNYNVATGIFEDFVNVNSPLLTVNSFTTPVILPIPRTAGGKLKIKTRCVDSNNFWNNRYLTYSFDIFAEFGAGVLTVDSHESVAKTFTIYTSYEKFAGKTDIGTHVRLIVNELSYYLPMNASWKYTFSLDILTFTGFYDIQISSGYFPDGDDGDFIGGQTTEISNFFLIPKQDISLTYEVTPC